VGFSRKTAVPVLLVGVVMAAAFSLHRLQAPAHRICNYRNWQAPCHTSGFHADWVDIGAFGVVLVVAIAAGVIKGSWKRKPSSPRRVSGSSSGA
jgi:hypothetical protein